MKKILMLSLSAATLLGSCGTYTATGAYAGASLGGIFGSAVGGISDGPRGSDVGTLIGMAGGAVVGAAIGNAADQERENKIAEARQARSSGSGTSSSSSSSSSVSYSDDDVYSTGAEDSGFDPTNSGDDRLDIDMDASSSTSSYTQYTDETLTLRNIEFTDDGGDGFLNPDETGKITFEIMNYTPNTVYDVTPSVEETTGNRYVYVSQSVRVESIESGKGIRYTAMVKGGSKLKSGKAVFSITIATGDGTAQPGSYTLAVATYK